MYKCIKLNKCNVNEFKALNKYRLKFNRLNKDFFDVYNKSSFTNKIFLKRKVKLLNIDSEYIGYIWTGTNNKNNIYIHSMSVDINDNSVNNLNLLIDAVKKDDKKILYMCENNDINFKLLSQLNFHVKSGTIELESDLSEKFSIELKDNIEFKILEKGKRESLRCYIQNEVFKNDSRIPLTVADICFDESQDYYFDKGSIFMKLNDKYIGYGQIIIQNHIPTIVNLGVLDKFRGKGYGRCLIKYLLKIVEYNGFNNVLINVNFNNQVALNLYKKHGFKTKREYCTWELDG